MWRFSAERKAGRADTCAGSRQSQLRRCCRGDTAARLPQEHWRSVWLGLSGSCRQASCSGWRLSRQRLCCCRGCFQARQAALKAGKRWRRDVIGGGCRRRGQLGGWRHETNLLCSAPGWLLLFAVQPCHRLQVRRRRQLLCRLQPWLRQLRQLFCCSSSVRLCSCWRRVGCKARLAQCWAAGAVSVALLASS
jgi:hypothetical protein